MKYKQKLIRATDLRSVLDRLDKGEISFSYAATLLSDIAEQRLLLLDVSGQRELLFAFEDYWAKNNCDGENFADVVNSFLGK